MCCDRWPGGVLAHGMEEEKEKLCDDNNWTTEMTRYDITLGKLVPEEWLRLKLEAKLAADDLFAQVDARFPMKFDDPISKQDVYNYVRRIIQKMKIMRDLRAKGVEPYASLVDDPFWV